MKERIVGLDVLRGVAALGILVENVIVFGLPIGWAPGSASFTGVVFEYKMMALFSMLFGAGVVLMHLDGVTVGALVRRLVVLLGIGLVHAYGFWFGDILAAYAVCGLLLLPARRLSGRLLVGLGLAVVMVPVFIGTSGSGEYSPGLLDDPALLALTPWEAMKLNAYRALSMQTTVFAGWTVWRASGLMLLGMGLAKLGFLTGRWTAAGYRRVLVLGLLVGVPVGLVNNYAGSIAVAVAYAAAVFLWCRGLGFARLRERVACVGRAALTSYLLQTCVMLVVFSAYGFDLFGVLPRWSLWLLVAVVWLVQLVAFPEWFRTYRSGPFEWLWRRLYRSPNNQRDRLHIVRRALGGGSVDTRL